MDNLILYQQTLYVFIISQVPRPKLIGHRGETELAVEVSLARLLIGRHVTGGTATAAEALRIREDVPARKLVHQVGGATYD